MKTTALVVKLLVFCLLGVAQHAFATLTVREKNITQVYIRNACHEVLDVNIEYIPKGGSNFRKANYIFSPGEKGYLVDTENLYVYITAKSRDSARQWSRSQVNVGRNSGKYTYSLTCRR